MWSAGMPAASAATLTGGGVVFLPRPERLSGLVKTPTTSSGPSMRAWRQGTAKSGVPMKAMRRLVVIWAQLSVSLSSGLSSGFFFFLFSSRSLRYWGRVRL